KAAKREEEGWLDTNSIEQFPCTDLRTIDQLWVKYSQGKYGFSVQKKIWQKAGEKWNAFCREVGWERYAKWFFGGWVDMKSIKYQGDAPRGHLPVIDAPRVSFYMGSLLEALSRRDL
ncbi:GUN4 domain-containing protein, partial [Nodularia spumigena]|uniref:GUN4 domain-containing protein n=1 Tax=Nodularia spumigena TaxID=70799 RepID=UPI0030DC3E2F